MTSGRYGLVLREVGRLLGGGTVASLGAGPLLERFVAERDGAAFEALVGRHGPMVLGTCRRMLADPHDVDDAFQATFLVLARKAGSIEDPDRLGPWLHGVARRVAARSRALSSRRQSRERPVGDEPAAESTDLLEGLELRETLDEELSRLPDKYRAPLVLCYLEGLTHDEAAEQLRWPVGTVRSRLAGGRDRLRAALTRRGLAPSAAVPVVLTRASVPQALLSTTVRVATAAGSPSAHVLTLAKGALIAMTWNKLKLMAAAGLMATLTVGGAGVSAQYGGMGQAGAKTETQIKAERSEPKRGALKIDELRHAEDLLVETEMARLQAEARAVEKTIKELRAQHAEALRPLEKSFADLDSRYGDLAERWKKRKADSASTALDDRIKALEKQVADQKAIIRLLQGRGDDFGGIPGEEKGTKAADPAKITTDVRPPIDPTSTKVAATDDTTGPGAALSANPPAAEAKKTADSTRKQPSPKVVPLGEFYVMVIPSEQDRVTVLNTETGTKSTHRFAGVVTEIIPIVSPGGVSLRFKGPEVRQVVAYDHEGGKWYPQDLVEPTTEANPVLGGRELIYQLGRFVYVFSFQAKKWGVLELKRDPGRLPFVSGMGGMQNSKRVISDGDLIHIYNPKTGEWTHMNTKDDK